MSLSYYILDTETTGIKQGYHEINQISIIRVDDNQQILYDIKVDHPNRAAVEALRIQQITHENLYNGLDKLEVVNKIEDWFMEDGQKPSYRCIIAHNSSFDKRFIHALWDSVNKHFPADLWLCTQQFARAYVKNHSNPQLIAQAQLQPKPKFGLNIFMEGVGLTPKTGAHQANIDTENTLVLYKFLIKSGVDYLSLIKRDPHRKSTVEEIFSDA